GATDRETGRPVIPRSSTAERPAVNRQVIGSSPIAGAPGRARRKRTGGPNRVPDPGCEKDGESGREHPAKALGWRRPAGPYRPGTPAIPRSSTAERPAVNRQVIGSSPIAGAMRSKVLPVGEGPALPSPTTTLKGHAPRAAPHTSLSRAVPAVQPARCRSPRGYDADTAGPSHTEPRPPRASRRLRRGIW